MTTLVTDTETIHSVDYCDFEAAVRECYGVEDYDFVADAECGNGMSILCGSMKKSTLSSEERMDLEAFQTSGSHRYLYRVLLQDMVNNGVAPEGDYVIKVSW